MPNRQVRYRPTFNPPTFNPFGDPFSALIEEHSSSRPQHFLFNVIYEQFRRTVTQETSRIVREAEHIKTLLGTGQFALAQTALRDLRTALMNAETMFADFVVSAETHPNYMPNRDDPGHLLANQQNVTISTPTDGTGTQVVLDDVARNRLRLYADAYNLNDDQRTLFRNRVLEYLVNGNNFGEAVLSAAINEILSGRRLSSIRPSGVAVNGEVGEDWITLRAYTATTTPTTLQQTNPCVDPNGEPQEQE